jgi:hypothetical protein
MDEFIDIYCERTALGVWDEPLNLVSNLAFFVAAFFVFLKMRRTQIYRADIVVLLALMVAIGAGSAAFHAFATYRTMIMDMAPIMLFQMVFIVSYGWFVIGGVYRKTVCAVLLLLFVAGSLFFGRLPYEWVNGSLGYAPALLFLIGFGVYHLRARKAGEGILLWAAGIFAVSLIFRTLDRDICDAFAPGVHFMWHVLNAIVLYLCVRALITAAHVARLAGIEPSKR